MNKAWIIVTKKEMTRVWDNWKMISATIVKILPQEVLRFKTQEKDGYDSVVIWVNKKKLKKDKWMKIKYSMTTEFRNIDEAFSNDYKSWATIDINLFEGIDEVSVRWTAKGKGFQWVMKRFHTKWWPKTHGSKFHRQIWSLGNRKPRRVQKGHPHAGRMWGQQTTLKNIRIIDKITQDNEQLLLLKWSIPGSYNWFIKILA
jgi:large subunit ribosomal protein L3